MAVHIISRAVAAPTHFLPGLLTPVYESAFQFLCLGKLFLKVYDAPLRLLPGWKETQASGQ